MTEISNSQISFRKLFDVKSYPEMHLSFLLLYLAVENFYTLPKK